MWDFAKDTIQSDTTVYAGWAVTDNGDSGSNDSDDSAFEDTERTELSNVSAAIANIKAGFTMALPTSQPLKLQPI